MMRETPLRPLIGVLATALFCATACSSQPAGSWQSGAPAEVGVIAVKAHDIPLTVELPGRVQASRTAEIRARVTGIILSRDFEEGSTVAKGDRLFQIDPAPFRAALERAEAQRTSAEATLTQQEARTQKIRKLAPLHAVSQQELVDANAQLALAEAAVATAAADVTTAKLDLSYATIRAPIGGRIGRAEVTEGALVVKGTATPLATIQQLDPVYVNLSQSAAEIRALRQAVAQGNVLSTHSEVAVQVVFSDGTVYDKQGSLLFTDITVDPTTGTVQLRATFPNPDAVLLPGAFVRARLAKAVDTAGLTVPQQAVQRSPRGPYVMTVGDDAVAIRKEVTLAEAIGHNWRVLTGLKDGDQVIVEGLQHVRDGATVIPKPWE